MGDKDKSNEAEHSSPIEFPCDFTIKIMGKQNDSFNANTHALILKHFPETKATQFTSRPSKDNNYLAITVTVYAQNKAELDALYTDLSKATDVIMAL